MYIKSTPLKIVISTSKAKATMPRAEPMVTCTAGIYTLHLTRFTMLTVSRTQVLYLYNARCGSNGKIDPAEFLPLLAK